MIYSLGNQQKMLCLLGNEKVQKLHSFLSVGASVMKLSWDFGSCAFSCQLGQNCLGHPLTFYRNEHLVSERTMLTLAETLVLLCFSWTMNFVLSADFISQDN